MTWGHVPGGRGCAVRGALPDELPPEDPDEEAPPLLPPDEPPLLRPLGVAVPDEDPPDERVYPPP